jgi:hypothetical protein
MMTYFIDLDGTICIHSIDTRKPDIILPGVLEFLKRKKDEGCYFILTTARFEYECKNVLKQLKELIDFEFDKMIFGIPATPRTLINDNSSTDKIKSFSISVKRNQGFEHLKYL